MFPAARYLNASVERVEEWKFPCGRNPGCASSRRFFRKKGGFSFGFGRRVVERDQGRLHSSEFKE
jgi:hypothetical protein